MPTQQDYEDKGIPDKEIFDRLVARQDEMPRRHCAVHNREEFKYEALEHELHAATPPTTPSDAAMRAAEESVAFLFDEYPDNSMDRDGATERVASIIMRHLAATPNDAEREFLAASVAVWREIDRLSALPEGYKGLPPETDPRKRELAAWERYRAVLDAAATTSPETPVGGEVPPCWSCGGEAEARDDIHVRCIDSKGINCEVMDHWFTRKTWDSRVPVHAAGDDEGELKTRAALIIGGDIELTRAEFEGLRDRIAAALRSGDKS